MALRLGHLTIPRVSLRLMSTSIPAAHLADAHCTPCSKKAIREQGIERLPETEAQRLLGELRPGWSLAPQPFVGGTPADAPAALQRVYRFRNFATAAAFASAVGHEADAEGHHPAILLEWGSVAVWWWSHALAGVRYLHDLLTQLHTNDFVMAARTDRLAEAADGRKD